MKSEFFSHSHESRNKKAQCKWAIKRVLTMLMKHTHNYGVWSYMNRCINYHSNWDMITITEELENGAYNGK